MFALVGDEKVQAVFRALKGKAGKKAQRKGLRAGGKVIARELRSTSPQLTGAMKKSIRVRAAKRRGKGIGINVQIYAENPKTRAPYSMFVKTGAKNQPQGGRVRKDRAGPSKAYNALEWRTQPNPFDEEALKRAGPAAVGAALQAIQAELQKAAGGQA